MPLSYHSIIRMVIFSGILTLDACILGQPHTPQAIDSDPVLGTQSSPILLSSNQTMVNGSSTPQFSSSIISSSSVNGVPISSSSLRVQSIQFEKPSDYTFGETSTFSLTVSATSNLDVQISSVTPNVCTNLGKIVTIVSPGSCILIASQGGDNSWATAASVTQIILIKDPSKKDQFISFGSIPAKVIGDPDFIVSANSTVPGLVVDFTSTSQSVCTVVKSTVHLVGAGLCTIVANQGGDATYNAAQSVPQSFIVLKKDQQISFSNILTKTMGEPAFDVRAVASSGLATYIYSQTPLICSVSGVAVSLLNAGTCTLSATQVGDLNYNAAAEVVQSFVINPAPISSSSTTISSSVIMSSSAIPISSSVLVSSSSTVSSSASKTMNLTINTTSFGPPCQNTSANVIAVYVTDAQGVFKKTLKFNAATRVQYLAQWKTAAAVTAVSAADGYAGATRNGYTPYSMTWNLLDKSGTRIPDGNYILKMEGACDNIKDQQTAQVPFAITSGTLSPGTKTGSASFSIGAWTLQ